MRSIALLPMLQNTGASRIPIFIFLLLLLTSGVSIGLAAEFWETNDYRLWSDKECAKLLESSPWAKEFTLNQVLIMPKGDAKATLSGIEHQPYVKYIARLQSASPIRKALVRKMQIDQKYEGMSEVQKQTFDKKAEEYLSSGPSNSIIVYIEYTTNHPPYELDLAHWWQSQTTAAFKNSTHLIIGKNWIPITSYTPAERGFQFIFPRELDGKPVLSANDKSIKLEFPYPDIGGVGDGRVLLEFKVKKMMINGDVAY
jgi:hypothetical protein